MIQDPILNVENLKFSYEPPIIILNDLNFKIYPNEVYALLGENGSGKTTTLKIITGLLSNYQGSISLLGKTFAKDEIFYKQKISYMPEVPILYAKLTVSEYLEFMSALKRLPATTKVKAENLLKSFGMWDKRNNFCDSLSKGMQQKLFLIANILHEPELLIMDEPFTGIDALGISFIKNFLKNYVSQNKAVLLTTHILPFVEELATKVGFIKKGQIITEGTKNELYLKHRKSSLEEIMLALNINKEYE